MTPEKRLSALYTLISASGDLRSALPNLDKDPAAFVSAPYPALSAAAALILECREQLDKQTGGGSRLTVVKRIVRDATGRGIDGQAGIDGFWYVTDGYRIFRFTEKLNAIPDADIARSAGFWKAAPRYFEAVGPVVDLPTVGQLKEHIAKYGAKRTVPGKESLYKVGEAYYNVFYLLDALQALGSCSAEQLPDQTGERTWRSALVVTNERGEACYLLPVKP
jgi:hypothetical protein